VTSAALARGKHVVTDKPLAMMSVQAKRLVDEAQRAGVVAAVTFNYRGNPLVEQARLAIARGDIGTPHFLRGHYLQDWLIKDTDYSWRLDREKGGPSRLPHQRLPCERAGHRHTGCVVVGLWWPDDGTR
jgi:predicted dehydrogenase